ncbi:clpS [Acrasis kona]|uniref:ClpS n=1 Tax=Acrasis kona TaxID=1008807 RepID=A0AAW2ZBZ9_9EUKA
MNFSDVVDVPELIIECLSFLDAYNIGVIQSLVCKQWLEYCRMERIWRNLTFNSLGWPKLSEQQNPPITSNWKNFYRFLQKPSNLTLLPNSFCTPQLLVNIATKKIIPPDNVELIIEAKEDGVLVAVEPLYRNLALSKQLKQCQNLALDDITIEAPQKDGAVRILFDIKNNDKQLEKLKQIMDGSVEVKAFILNNDTTNITTVVRLIRKALHCDYQTADKITHKAHITGHGLMKKTSDFSDVERIVRTLAEGDVEILVRRTDENPMDLIFSEYFDNTILPVRNVPPSGPKSDFEVILFTIGSDISLNTYATDLSKCLDLPYNMCYDFARGLLMRGMIARLFRGSKERADEIFNFFDSRGYDISLVMCDSELQEDDEDF